MPHQSRRIDTSRIVLDEDIIELAEQLAEHVHHVWVHERLATGWRYGPQRDDSKQEHPCLVPYSQLLESERAVDRGTALETLKALIALGYGIERRT